MRRGVVSAVVWTALLLAAPAAAPAQFALDPSFGSDGRAVTPIGWRPSLEVQVVRAQHDAALLLGGLSVTGDVRRPTLVRLRRTGLRDREFGDRGEVRLPLGGEEASVAGVVEQDGGRLVALASAGPDSVSGTQLVVGLHHDGSPDPAFGYGGVVDVAQIGLLRAYAIARDAAGRLVIAGTTGEPALVRLTADGAVDASFGAGGLAAVADHTGAAVAVDVGPGDTRPLALTVGYDGLPKAVVRLTAEGTVDLGFGDQGTTELWFTPGWPRIAVDFAGRSVVPTRHGVARLGPDGGRDPWFAQLSLGEFREPTTVAVEPDGGVLYGVTRYMYAQDGELGRLHPDGAPDGAFGGTYHEMSRPSGVTALPAGGAAMAAHPADVVKVTGSGQLDPTFHGDGRRSVGAGDRSVAFANGMEALADGRVVTAGGAWFDDAFRVVLARHRSDGTRDGSFAGCGVSVGPTTWARMRVDDVALDGGATLLAGEETTFGGSGRFLVGRVLADGAPDPAFGDAGQAAIAVPDGATGRAAAVGADAAGRVLVAGMEYVGAAWGRTVVTRLLRSGEVDPTWAAGGWMYGPENTRVTDLRPLSDGGAYVTAADWPKAEGFSVLRLTSMGTREPAFGDGGVARVEVPGWPAEAVPTADGGIVVGVAPDPHGIVRLVKLTPAGTLDPTFGVGGIATLHRDHSSFVGVGIRTDAVGRLLVSSTLLGDGSNGEEGGRVAVARVHAVSGQPDETFGSEGWLIGPAPDDATTPYVAVGAAEQPSGRVVVAGRVGGPSFEFGLLGFTEGGEPPPPAEEAAGAPADDCGFGPPEEPLGSAAEDPPLPPAQDEAPPRIPADDAAVAAPAAGDRSATAAPAPKRFAPFTARARSPQSLLAALRKGVAVELRCPAACRIVLAARAAGTRSRRVLRLPVGSRVVRVRLPRTAKRQLRRARRPKIVVDVVATVGAQRSQRDRVTIALRRP